MYRNPYTGSPYVTVPVVLPEEVEEAIAARSPSVQARFRRAFNLLRHGMTMSDVACVLGADLSSPEMDRRVREMIAAGCTPNELMRSFSMPDLSINEMTEMGMTGDGFATGDGLAKEEPAGLPNPLTGEFEACPNAQRKPLTHFLGLCEIDERPERASADQLHTVVEWLERRASLFEGQHAARNATSFAASYITQGERVLHVCWLSYLLEHHSPPPRQPEQTPVGTAERAGGSGNAGGAGAAAPPALRRGFLLGRRGAEGMGAAGGAGAKG